MSNISAMKDPASSSGGDAARHAVAFPPRHTTKSAVVPKSNAARIGEMLVADGLMTEQQVEQVLVAQQQGNQRFGEVAVRLGLVSVQHVEAVLARQFGLPTAADLSNAKLPPKIVAAMRSMSPFVESMRTLRSQLMMRWFDGTPNQAALAITSVDRGDGKSFISASLAVAFSQLGERTLLIDADLRHATQHQIFGLKNSMGLSGILSGRAGLDEIVRIEGLTNLAILPSGPTPPNPGELLGRPDFTRLLNDLSAEFDVILVDTPSAQEAADAHVVAQRAGAALLVGRKDSTRSREIAQLTGILTSSGINVLGATLNEY